jgi:hypothetical protein
LVKSAKLSMNGSNMFALLSAEQQEQDIDGDCE